MNPASAFAQSDYYNFSKLNTDNGLSHNQVSAITKDSEGFLWFGTRSGLNRYDGYSFKIFRKKNGDSTSLKDNSILSLFRLPHNKLWVVTKDGSCIYNGATERFDSNCNAYLQSLGLPSRPVVNVIEGNNGRYWFLYEDRSLYMYADGVKGARRFNHLPHATPEAKIASVGETKDGKLWLIYQNGLLQQYDIKSDKVVSTNSSLQRFTKGPLPYSLLIDKDGDVWLGCPSFGVYLFQPHSGLIKLFSESTFPARLSSNVVAQMVQDDNGLIWIATDNGGVTLINKKNNFKTTNLLNDPEDPKSISQNAIVTVYKDDQGIIWLGTYKQGVNYLNGSVVQFELYHHQKSNSNSLPYNDIDKLVEDKFGNIWIGTNGGGLIYFDRKNDRFKQYVHNPGNKYSLSSNVIVSLCIDHEGTLWIGTYYGGLNKFDGKKFVSYRHADDNQSSLANDNVFDILEDKQDNLWIATLGSGLDLFDRKQNNFKHLRYELGKAGPLRSNFVSPIMEDHAGNLWIGTDAGITVLKKDRKTWVHYQHTNDKGSLSNNNIISLLADSKNRIWIGTREGLNLFNNQTGKFQTFTISDGLPDNIISSMLEDQSHTLWIGTPNGLCNAIPNQKRSGPALTVINYDQTNNLQNSEFNDYAALKTKKGELFFGGSSGFNIINTNALRKPDYQAKIAFTGLQILNKDVEPGDSINNRILLDRSLIELSEIKLKYRENVFAITFASLDFAHSKQRKYAYMLEGFNTDWLYSTGSQHAATYTNLDPGSYTFKVKVLNSDGLWSEIKHLQIVIDPPFWRTSIAYIIYFLIIAGILFVIRRVTLDRIYMRYEVAKQRMEAERAHTLEKLKTKFFTNVSHEFRTPLSLIISPLDKIINQTQDAEQKKQLGLVQRNAKRLLNLVNQLLDFRKMEVQEIALQRKPGDIIKFIRDNVLSFADIAEERNIKLLFDSEVDSLITSFDHNKIERILFNLLSNAFKFTQPGGRVSVLLYNLSDEASLESRVLEINVIDTGIGIPIEKQERIFERFFQNDVPESLINQGSGIGLSITKEFVKMHNGVITVESEPDRGSRFRVRLPLPIIESLAEVPLVNESEINELQAIVGYEKDEWVSQYADKNRKPLLLLVEDNEDFRFYLKDNLKDAYSIVEASNGKEGWQKALSQHPDIVVSDISMPEMNGIDLCKKIKSDKRTSSIPVILLTALTDEEAQLKGLGIGANDYITKPFNFLILISKIKNLLILQESFKATYQKQINVQLAEVSELSEDEKFLKNCIEYIEQNILSCDLTVEDLSSQMNMSRVSLYKKMLALTGKTPVEFIRSIRLKKAVQLIENNQMSISQICYEVGFNTPKYFAKSFRKEYNMLPSEYVNSIRKEKAARSSDERQL